MSKAWASVWCDIVLRSLGTRGAHHPHVIFEEMNLKSTMRLLQSHPLDPVLLANIDLSLQPRLVSPSRLYAT